MDLIKNLFYRIKFNNINEFTIKHINIQIKIFFII